MKFFGHDDDLVFLEELRKPGQGRVNERKSLFEMTDDESAYQADKIQRNINADYERLGVVKNPWLAIFYEL